jgi:hypothetical protein
MRVNKAKRRWLKWARYVVSTGTVASGGLSGGYHNAHAKAYEDVQFAGRYAPIGPRRPYYAKWMWQ